MIRIGNEYLEYDGMPEVVRQVKSADTIDTAGDFSYSFSIPLTNNNVRILKIGINRTDTLVPYRIDCTIEELGTAIYSGYLRIEAVTNNIELSFFSGNSEWFADLQGKFIYNLDLSQFKLPIVNTDPNPTIPATWTVTEGIVYAFGPDVGYFKNWSGFRLPSTAFKQMVYVKNVMNAIFQQNGYKMAGELLTESRYINSIAGADDGDGVSGTPSIRKSRSAFVGKTTQSINTTPQLVTFTDTSYPYYVGNQTNFAGNRYTATEDISVAVKVNLTLDASTDYILELYINGASAYTVSGTGSTISIGFNDGDAISFDEGDYAEVFMSVNSGTVNITTGDVTYKQIRFDAEYPQFLFSDMSQTDFVRSIFTMFNVVASFDPYTKTVTMNLFKNIDSVQQDLSQYLEGTELNFTEPLDDFSKNNIFQYEASDDEDQQAYNEGELVPYGGGNISPVNEFLDGTNEKEVRFSSSFSYYNEKLQANMMGLGIVDFDQGAAFSITSVADNGSGIALFTTAEPHGLNQFDYAEISSTSTGQYLGIGLVNSVPSDTTFTIQYLAFESFGSVGFTGSGFVLSSSTNISGKIFIMINIPNMLVSDFSHKSTINYSGTLYDRVAYAYFVKSDLGLPIDNYKEVLAFANPVDNGFTGITLLDSYYGHTKKYLDNPVKIRGRFRMPYHVFNNLDLTKSIRVKTAEFNSLCFSQKMVGYNPCEIELIQL